MTSRIALGLFLALFAGRPAPAADPPVQALEAQVQKVIEDASPSVVSVVVSHSKNYGRPAKAKPGELGDYEAKRPTDIPGFGRGRFRGEQPTLDRLDLSLVENVADHLFGSGLVLDADQGLILTTHHLTDGATKVFVRGAGGKGSYANIVASDAKSDLTVLRLISAINDLKTVKFAEVRWVDEPKGRKANLKAGSAVVALGHPLAGGAGDGVPSASWGIISKFNTRSAAPPVLTDSITPRPLHTYGGLFQVDARVTLGSSGAGVFNLDGQLVGLGSAVAAVFGSEASGGYAIPMDVNYRRIIDVLKSGREVEYGFLGVGPQADEARNGVQISSLSPSCPAAAAGLMQFDLVTAIDGHPLRTTDDLLHFVAAALAGSEVTVDYQRGGRPFSTRVKLAKNPNALPSIASVPPPAHFGLQVEYQSVKFAGPVGGFRNQPPPNPPPGVVVRELVAGSAAAKRFDELGAVRSWWVITHVDGKPVTTPSEYDAAVRGKTSVKLVLADASDPAIRQTVTLP
jgi:serine protease Do